MEKPYQDLRARIRAHQSPDDRARSAIMEKVTRVYVRMNRDEDLVRKFDAFLEDFSECPEVETQSERAYRLEANMLLLLAPSGAGKSRAIRRLFEKHPVTEGYGVPRSGCPVVTVRCPSPCGMLDLGREVLRQTGWELKRQRVFAPELWTMVRRRLREIGTDILHLDELQHAPQSLNTVERQKLLNVLKALLVDEDHPIGLVISGMPEIEAFIVPDRQVTRRGIWLTFEPLTMAGDAAKVASTVREMAKVAGLTVAKDIEQTLVSRLLHAGCYQMGIVCEEIHDAIRHGLKFKSPSFGVENFASAYAFRTGSLERWNPYLAQNFLALDTTKVLVRREPPPPPATTRGSKTSKGKQT